MTSPQMTPQPLHNRINPFRPLTPAEIGQLKSQNCYCQDWSKVKVCDNCDMRLIRSCRFSGDVNIGMLAIDSKQEQGIFNAVVQNCTIGNHVFISGVSGRLEGLTIADNVRIENAGRIIAEPEADYGVGVEVSVLDETGSRPVYIYPGLTSQIAALMAYRPHWTEDAIVPVIDDLRERMPRKPTIDEGAEIIDTRYMFNVRVGKGVRIHGAARLKNGTVLNNAISSHSLTYIGNDVDAEDFIIEDGKVDSGTLIRRCYVGQGVELEKRFTAHDSLFFANSSCECGEACAIMAGPYTVTMHKSSLLIGGEYSFFNAGSATNSSNHKYKLGPVHWGVMQRGVKTASGAYMMWGAKVGAFSLLMGVHKTHPDTSAFPFSYLFGETDGSTLVAPGLMLKSCGLMRDELKWPKRDRRIKGRVPLHDNICFEVLNPMTVGAMINALPLLREIGNSEVDENGCHLWKGLHIRSSSIERGIQFYSLAIAKYLHTKLKDAPAVEISKEPIQWCDLGGQLLPVTVIDKVVQAETIEEMQYFFDEAFSNYASLERQWILQIMTPELKALLDNSEKAIACLDALVEKDRKQYLATLSAHNSAFSL